MKLMLKHMPQHNQTEADSHRIRSDITNYLQYVPYDDDDDPLVFWGRGLFPSLQHTARNSKPQCIIRACGKHAFHKGTTSLLLNGKCSTLAPHRANWLTFIHNNYTMYFDTDL